MHWFVTNRLEYAYEYTTMSNAAMRLPVEVVGHPDLLGVTDRTGESPSSFAGGLSVGTRRAQSGNASSLTESAYGVVPLDEFL